MTVWTVYLSLCLLMALSASVPLTGCLSGWSAYGCRCFRFFSDAHTWIDAEKSCLGHGGHLASVHSKEEYTFIQNLIKSVSHTGTRTWLGGHDAVHEGHWLWTDGTKMEFQRWSSGEPNNDSKNEHCLEMNYDDNWNDDKCYEKKSFLCVKK